MNIKTQWTVGTVIGWARVRGAVVEVFKAAAEGPALYRQGSAVRELGPEIPIWQDPSCV